MNIREETQMRELQLLSLMPPAAKNPEGETVWKRNVIFGQFTRETGIELFTANPFAD